MDITIDYIFARLPDDDLESPDWSDSPFWFKHKLTEIIFIDGKPVYEDRFESQDSAGIGKALHIATALQDIIGGEIRSFIIEPDTIRQYCADKPIHPDEFSIEDFYLIAADYGIDPHSLTLEDFQPPSDDVPTFVIRPMEIEDLSTQELLTALEKREDLPYLLSFANFELEGWLMSKQLATTSRNIDYAIKLLMNYMGHPRENKEYAYTNILSNYLGDFEPEPSYINSFSEITLYDPIAKVGANNE
jgi:hypothetical protein